MLEHLDTPEPGLTSASGALRRQERKFATVLFADIVDSTGLGEREDPEVVRALVGGAFEQLAEIVERHGGTLEKFIGDAILAVFGVPATHEDDPERAVRAALAMQQRVGNLDREPRLALRIGIEAGEILVDLDRVEGSRDRMLTGDAVNVAARVQQNAEPGSVLVGPAVHAATKEVVEYRQLPYLDVKGKARPLPVWAALRVRTPRGARPSLGLRARLIGREDELALLERRLSWVRSERRPALVSVLGSAGVGKSRLARELVERLEEIDATATVRTGRCLAYANVSYSALADAVKAECGVREDDPPDVVSQKLAGRATDLFGDAEVVPYLAALVGAGEGEAFRREDLFDAWRRFVERLASRSPLVLLLEDIHWADDGLLDFLEYLADWAQGPLVVLTLARPELLERRPSWGGGKRNYSAIFLEPLTSDETVELVEDLLAMRLPDELRRAVIERSEGNPLFGEEIVRMLIDRGVLELGPAGWEVAQERVEIEIPRSIQALIAARVDSLPADEKATLQDAAVVGRTLWVGAVAHLAGSASGEAREVLSRLRVKELVLPSEPSAFSGEPEFVFRHALIRDVAYESLPKSTRAEKHLEVAQWAKGHAGRRREEIAELLAAHCVQALRYLGELGIDDAQAEQEGFQWARAAGERALRLWQQREAVRWFGAALELAERVDVSRDEVASLWEEYATAGEEAVAYREVADALESALRLYEEQGRDREAGRIEAHLGYIAQQSGELDEALPWTKRALARLERFGDSRDLALALHVLGWHEFRTVRFEEAEEHLRRALEMAERVEDDVVRTHALASLAFVYQQTQRDEESLALFEESLALARGSGDLSLLLRVLVHMEGALQEFRGDYRRGIELAREGLELARRAGNTANVAWTTMFLSDFALELGYLDESAGRAAEALEAARAVGDPIVVGYSLERLAYLAAVRGDPAEAERRLAEVRPLLEQNPDPWLQGWAPLIAGHIAQGRENEEEAADVLAGGARQLLGRILVWGGRHLLLECVRALARVGRADEARPFRDRLEVLAASSVPARAMLTWADGILETDPAVALELLSRAARQLEELENRIELGRCLNDLVDTQLRSGAEPHATVARAREILGSCGAELFLREMSPDLA